MGIRTSLLEIKNLQEKIDPKGNTWFVDGTNGSDTYSGTDWDHAFATIQAAVTAASAGGTIRIAPKLIAAGATDPNSYAETIIIPAATTNLKLIGEGHPVQGGIPQIKKGSGATALLTIRAMGCLIENIGFNGIKEADSTPSLVGILLDDDGSTKAACGTTIRNCHFKNCAGTNVLSGATGGAITWSANGGAWQVKIEGCTFYKNVCDISLLGTSVSVPQDVVIQNNIFSGPASVVDINLFLKGGGSGMNGVTIKGNIFPAMPALTSGVNALFGDLTGCVGIMSGNKFAETAYNTGWKAAGAKMKVPATVFMVGNYSEGGLISRQA